MTLTKHAKQRYKERFGAQSDSEIIRRCIVAQKSSVTNEGFTHKIYGAILFVVVDDTIITVKNIYKNPFKSK